MLPVKFEPVAFGGMSRSSPQRAGDKVSSAVLFKAPHVSFIVEFINCGLGERGGCD